MKYIYIKNKRLPLLGTIELIKFNACNPQITLAGAIFDLYWFNPNVWEYEIIQTNLQTDENGKLTIHNLAIGKYKLIEIIAPQGYQRGKEALFVEVKMDQQGNVIKTKTILAHNFPLPVHCHKKCICCKCKKYCYKEGVICRKCKKVTNYFNENPYH